MIGDHDGVGTELDGEPRILGGEDPLDDQFAGPILPHPFDIIRRREAFAVPLRPGGHRRELVAARRHEHREIAESPSAAEPAIHPARLRQHLERELGPHPQRHHEPIVEIAVAAPVHCGVDGEHQCLATRLLGPVDQGDVHPAIIEQIELEEEGRGALRRDLLERTGRKRAEAIRDAEDLGSASGLDFTAPANEPRKIRLARERAASSPVRRRWRSRDSASRPPRAPADGNEATRDPRRFARNETSS